MDNHVKIQARDFNSHVGKEFLNDQETRQVIQRYQQPSKGKLKPESDTTHTDLDFST